MPIHQFITIPYCVNILGGYPSFHLVAYIILFPEELRQPSSLIASEHLIYYEMVGLDLLLRSITLCILHIKKRTTSMGLLAL